MDKCPFCGAETRPGDNFCLNCGNRLLSATPSASSQQAQPAMGDATLAAPDDWGAALQGNNAPPAGWVDDAAKTLADPSAEPTYRSDAPTAQANGNIEKPARFILRSESGEVLQEYPLDKSEIVIGRAPSSDILLSKDKLTSRRHATVRYENDQYVLHDERSANGTFVNGQQMEEGVPRVLQDGDHIGIGEHELIFRAFESPATSVEDLQTVVVPLESAGNEVTYRTREDEMATVATHDEFNTHSMDRSNEDAAQVAPPPVTPVAEPVASSTSNGSVAPDVSIPSTPPVSVSSSSQSSSSTQEKEAPPVKESETGITFNRLTSLPQPTLPDLTNLIAALSTLDGQITALQEQFNATQEAMRNHEAEIAQASNQLRAGIRRVSERMDNTIADVARSREALAWAELMQLMEDVMNNPRDIEYVTKLARKARELNKVFQIHQNVLNTMAECNSLLRSMIGEER